MGVPVKFVARVGAVDVVAARGALPRATASSPSSPPTTTGPRACSSPSSIPTASAASSPTAAPISPCRRPTSLLRCSSAPATPSARATRSSPSRPRAAVRGLPDRGAGPQDHDRHRPRLGRASCAKSASRPFLSWTEGADLLLANREEAEALSATADLEEQMRVLGQRFARVVVKRGPDGAAIGDRERRHPQPARTAGHCPRHERRG